MTLGGQMGKQKAESRNADFLGGVAYLETRNTAQAVGELREDSREIEEHAALGISRTNSSLCAANISTAERSAVAGLGEFRHEAEKRADVGSGNLFYAGGKVPAESAGRAVGSDTELVAPIVGSPHETPVSGYGLPVALAPSADFEDKAGSRKQKAEIGNTDSQRRLPSAATAEGMRMEEGGQRRLPSAATVEGMRGGGVGQRRLPSAATAATVEELKAAEEKAGVCRAYEGLRAQGMGMGQAARTLGMSAAWFSGMDSPYGIWKRLGTAGMVGGKQKAESRKQKCGDLAGRINGLGWFVKAARFFNMKINRTVNSGSVPEAVRRTISLPDMPVGWTVGHRGQFLSCVGLGEAPVCPVDIREEIIGRERAGLPLVPESIGRQIVIRKELVRFARNPKDSMLRVMNAAGCSRFTRVSGEYEPLRCGQRMQPDDGSINFCVTVPWKFPTDTVSRKFGVMVGRFQLLLMVDALSLGIRARSFVVRPRSSYRQEDALHLYNVFMKANGVPEEIWHEGHVWNSGRVKDCLDLLKVRRHLVHSPHNKAAVEGRFNKLWTVLSGLTGGQIGRFRGEMERENELLVSCRSGALDPRRVFPPIEVALAAIDQAIKEANGTTVQTAVGRWVPDELWAEQVGETPLRKLDRETAWMFSPYCLERTINNGFNAKLPLFEDFSVPFCFASEWMPNYQGARAKCYFDPYGERFGTVVLAENWYGQKAGTVLGVAKQTNDIGEYARLMLGCGFGPDDSGRVIRQRQAAAMRSDRRAIAGEGREVREVTERDGVGEAATWGSDSKSEGRNPKAEGNPKAEIRRDSYMAAPVAVSRRAEDDPELAEFLGGDD